jgi:adenylate kinase family enzyme
MKKTIMKKTIRLTESDLTRIVKRAIKEYHYEDDDDAHEAYVDERADLYSAVMTLLKPYYEKHGKEITLDFIDDIKTFVEDPWDLNHFDNY